MCDRFAPADKGVALPSPTLDSFASQTLDSFASQTLDSFASQTLDELAGADHGAAAPTHSPTTHSVRTVMRD
jgi:hypothetical protein